MILSEIESRELSKAVCKGDEVAMVALRERGYLVVGYYEHAQHPVRGQKLTTWAGMSLSQPIVITEETTQDDWVAQSRLLKGQFYTDPEVPRSKGIQNGRYFRAMTD